MAGLVTQTQGDCNIRFNGRSSSVKMPLGMQRVIEKLMMSFKRLISLVKIQTLIIWSHCLVHLLWLRNMYQPG